MKSQNPSFSFTKIVVIESLESHEVKTGEELLPLLSTYVSGNDLRLSIEYKPIDSVVEFRSLMVKLRLEAIEKHEIPILHFECHGSKSDGLEFANGSTLSWEDLSKELTKLNIATNFNLLVVFSACFGGYFLGEIKAISPAPCWGIVAPTHVIDPADAMSGFRIFYKVFLSTRDAGKAAAALVKTPTSEGSWFAQLAQLWFERIVMGYVKAYCTNAKVRIQAKRLVRSLRDEGQRASIGHMTRILKQNNRTNLTEKYFEIFFCTTHVPSAVERFEDVRKQIESKLDELRKAGGYVI